MSNKEEVHHLWIKFSTWSVPSPLLNCSVSCTILKPTATPNITELLRRYGTDEQGQDSQSIYPTSYETYTSFRNHDSFVYINVNVAAIFE